MGPPCRRVIAAPVVLIAALTHPQKLFDINCRSHIISCHTLSRIYCWSHWLGAEPPIKFLKSPRGPEMLPLTPPTNPNTFKQMSHANTGGRVITTTHLCTYMQLGWYGRGKNQECAHLVLPYGEIKQQRVKENYLWLQFKNLSASCIIYRISNEWGKKCKRGKQVSIIVKDRKVCINCLKQHPVWGGLSVFMVSVLMVRMIWAPTDQMEMQLQKSSGCRLVILGHLIANKCFHHMLSDYTLDLTLCFPCWLTVSL